MARVRVRWNYGMAGVVLAIAVGFAIDGNWWGTLAVLAFFPLAWLRARVVYSAEERRRG